MFVKFEKSFNEFLVIYQKRIIEFVIKIYN